MKRPYFTQCIVVDNGQFIWIKASVATNNLQNNLEERLPSAESVVTPASKLGLLKKNRYKLHIEGRDGNHTKIFEKKVETDEFGNIQIKIPSINANATIKRLQFFETSILKGMQLLIDSIIPFKVKFPLKILISDFDKTLVETKYSTLKEMYLSLNRPLSFFPTIETSLNMINKRLADDFQPFILSASPHFYEKSIRDWLYQNKIFTSNIFLKDYRDVLSWSRGELSLKDIKKQGFYKLDALVDILEFTTLPDELVLMGDGFESDTSIYLTLRSILIEKRDPWQVWNHVKKLKSFKLTTRQSFTFLQRLNKLASSARKKPNMKLSIYIRCHKDSIEQIKSKTLIPDFFETQKKFVNYYTA